MKTSSPIDIERIRLDIGDSMVCLDLVRRYLDDVGNRLGRVGAAVDSGDTITVHREVHSIKGGALNIHASGLMRAAARFEREVKEGNLRFAKARLASIKLEFEKAKRYFEDVRAERA